VTGQEHPWLVVAWLAMMLVGAPIAVWLAGELLDRHLRPVRALIPHRRVAGTADPLLTVGPVHGSKAAWLVVRPSDLAVAFAAVGVPVRYGLDAHARCVTTGAHEAPALWCGCGLYALRSRAAATRLARRVRRRRGAVAAVLDVELTGRVLEATRGFRSQRQRVTQVTVGGRCVACGAAPSLLTAGHPSAPRRVPSVGPWADDPLEGWAVLVPRCGGCASDAAIALTPAQATTALGCPVRLGGRVSAPGPVRT
jgi:hypothetical protein